MNAVGNLWKCIITLRQTNMNHGNWKIPHFLNIFNASSKGFHFFIAMLVILAGIYLKVQMKITVHP